MNYFTQPSLLEKTCPTFRAAYSDRTAWLLAEMSKLAYFKFEFEEKNLIQELASQLSHIHDTKKIKQHLTEFFKLSQKDAAIGKKKLGHILKQSGFKLIQTFNVDDTQAFLCKRDTDDMAILAFRGTESNKSKDIKTDLQAFLSKQENGAIHSGFYAAYNSVAPQIEAELSKLKNIPLYITGHSLGGALAIVATQALENDQLAACYTFGSPRVGNQQFSDTIKTPIYRLVNTADIVPRMPPGIIIELLVDLLRFSSAILPHADKIADWLNNKVSGYRHYGDMRYLTATHKADFSDVTLISNISGLDRWRRILKNRTYFNRYIQDHSIDLYSKKLAAYALKRQK